MQWTTKQDAILAEHSHKGAIWCAHELYRRCGVRRSVKAVERHGNRIGVSWMRYEVCPKCGETVDRLTASGTSAGLCRVCALQAQRDAARDAWEAAERSERKSAELLREANMYRQRTSRLNRK